jgi:glutamine synthetase
MSAHDASLSVDATTTLAELSERGVEILRVLYPDLHGIARGKDVQLREFEHVADSGLAFCKAVMGTDLRHTPVVPHGAYPDLVARPDLSTLRVLPWDPGVVACLADLHLAGEAPGPAPDPRAAVRRAAAAGEGAGFTPMVGPELEFFLCVPDDSAPGGARRKLDRLSMVYTVGAQADPEGVVRDMTRHLSAMGVGAFAVTHEFMNSQYEINLRHSEALDAADRAFWLRAAVKDMAAQHGLVATFMGKPFNDQGGSGFHLHLSLARDGENAFAGAGEPGGVTSELRAFLAGLIHHAPALMAFLNPTVNAYRRLVPDSLAPTHANWGWDNRTTFVRVPPERDGATRLEIRVGDASANAHLAIAAVLHAGLHGLRDGLEPPAPTEGDAYAIEAPGVPLPRSLEAALDALEGDPSLRGLIGPETVDPFVAVKRFECERHRQWVSDWELDEYLRHL